MARTFSGNRVRKQWGSVGTGITTQVSANITTIVAGFLSRTEAFTVMRLIGEYTIQPGAVNVINDQCVWTVGIGVVSNDAATANTSLPDPEDEPDYPWLYWASHNMSMQKAQQDSQGDPAMALRHTFDVHSMRKIKPREVLAVIIQFRDINGAPTYDLTWSKTRVLIGI